MNRTCVRPSLWAVLACLALAGCAQPDQSCSVTGRVLVNGKEAEGLYVAFHAVGDGPRQAAGSARTGKDGSFALRVPRPGEYAVTVFWPSVLVSEGETAEGEDRFKGKYLDPQRPALKAAVQGREHSLPPVEIKFP